MTAQEIRKKYLEFMRARGHKILPRAGLVPQDDPTTLFTGSGMQPMVPYLLGQKHPDGAKLADSQTCFRAEDMDEVGDNRHTTFFEMLGNWSLGDYFKQDQITMCWEFLTKELKLDSEKLWVSCFEGDEEAGVPKDEESAKIWEALGVPKERIVFYGVEHNWWSRAGVPSNMPDGEPGGPDSEVFYEFTQVKHDEKYGHECHPACDCGRFLEIGNNVFMTYKKVGSKFEPLPKPNVDFGGGLERIAMAVIDNPDIFSISVIKPIIDGLEELSGKTYGENAASMRVISDHMRAAVWLAVDGVEPSNKQQGYVLRRLVRRAIRYAFDLGIEQDLCAKVVPIVVSIFKDDYAEVTTRQKEIIETLSKEEKIFRQTLRKGINEFEKMAGSGLSGEVMFKLYDTYGFPVELTKEEAVKRGIKISEAADREFQKLMQEQRERSRTAGAGQFKGGLADSSQDTTKLHTATHLMYQAMQEVLGKHVEQKGANITAERIRFDFSHPQKVSAEEIAKIEEIVNQKIAEDLPVTWQEMPKEQALKVAHGGFLDRYGDKVKIYSIGDYSIEVCGGPHVEHTGQIGEGGKQFKIVKEENSSAGVRRFKAVLQ